MTNPCIICVAITGSLPRKENNPAVPITIAEQIESTQAAFEAGASIAHCHVRNDDQTPTSDPDRFALLLEGLRKHCPGLIVQLSTGGRSGAGAERGGMLSLRPDMASLSVGSNNFPTRVYENPPDLVDWLAAEMLKYDVKPEIEAFDLSHIHQAAAMSADGRLKAPLYVQFVMGVKNAMPVDKPSFDFYVETMGRIAPTAQWCGAGIGQNQIVLNEWSVAAGGHTRTGLEDNMRLDRDRLAPSNAALVARVADLCDKYQRPVATWAQAREILRAPGGLMAISPFDGALTAGLYGDAEIAALFSGAAEVRAMLAVEGALAKVQGDLGIIPVASAQAIERAAREVEIDPADLASGMASAGVPVAALVAGFREKLGSEHRGWVHWGATSQDIVDTALVSRLRRVLQILDARLGNLIVALGDQATLHKTALIAARTRSQIAAPTTVGAKIAVWCMPLIRHRERLAQLRPRLLMVSLAGAAGTNAALDGRGAEVMRALAVELDLAPSKVPWHAARDGMAELGGWLALLTGTLGKIGQDIILLGQSEVGEVTAGAGGGSSTMPQKANPVRAEALVTLARLNAGTVGQMYAGLVHAQERDGAALGLEWFALPSMCAAAGASTRHASALIEGLTLHGDRIAATFAADRGLMLAEAAVFLLAGHMPRPEAQALVAAAVADVRAGGTSLAEALEHRAPGDMEWESLLDPARHAGDAEQFVDNLMTAIGDTTD